MLSNAETIRVALLDYAEYRGELAAEVVVPALAALEEMVRETRRLDWLEGEMEREREAWAIFERSDPPGTLPPVALFRKNLPITRAAIDDAMQPTAEPIIIADLTRDEEAPSPKLVGMTIPERRGGKDAR